MPNTQIEEDVKIQDDNMLLKTFKFEVKRFDELSDDEFFFFEGYASTFGNVDRDGDVIDKGAFSNSIKERIPSLLWQHKTTEPIGIFTEIFEDDKGLFVKARMPKADTLVSGRVIPQIKVGSIRDMSVGFSIVKSESIVDDQFGADRRITEVKLWETSLVTIPANPKANITAFKSKTNAEMNFSTIREGETVLKEIGLSTDNAKSFISNLKKIVANEMENKKSSESSDKITALLSSLDSLYDTIKK